MYASDTEGFHGETPLEKPVDKRRGLQGHGSPISKSDRSLPERIPNLNMPIQSQIQNEDMEGINQFLRHCQMVTREARLIRDSLPNVDIPAARRSVTLLQAITTALDSLDSPWLDPEDIRSAQQEVLENLIPLEQFLSTHPGGQSTARRRFLYSGNRGRPPLDIDLDAAQEIHDLGNSWDSVAQALGTARSVLMDHMKKIMELNEECMSIGVAPTTPTYEAGSLLSFI